jgi:tRNA (cmo5U34)-methyltransferase
MTQAAEPMAFDQTNAASYDQRFTKLLPMKDALHLLMRLILSELPANARILCVGAGTGAELIYLAQAFPGWSFTAVDPSAPMLNICRQRVAEQGIVARCTFHEGYIDTLPEMEYFDAATTILVSQFILPQNERRKFFSVIASRLLSGGLLINADLAIDTADATSNRLFEMWLRAWKHTGVADEQLENLKASLDRSVAVLPPETVKLLIGSSGFDTPTQFLQTFLIHAWYAQKA